MTVYQYPTPPPYVFDPEEAHRLMFDAVEYIPLAILSFNDPPPGEVRLIQPTCMRETHPQRDEANRWLGAELRRRRALFREALERGDDLAFRWEQASQFAFFATKLIWQRFRLPMFIRDPTASEWTARFADLQVVERASVLYERHGDLLLLVDVIGGDFDLCPPTARGRRLRDTTVVSLRPVIEALAVLGLWVESDDEMLGLARTLIRLARQERGRLGVEEFDRRYAAGQPREGITVGVSCRRRVEKGVSRHQGRES